MQELDERARETMLAQVRTALLDELPRRRRRRRAVIGVSTVGAVVVACGVTGAAIVVNRASQQDIDHTAYCYSKADLNSLYGQAVMLQATPGPGASAATGQDAATDPLELCASVWRSAFGKSSDPNDLSVPTPVLVACKRADDVAATFPRGDSTASDRAFCGALGLAPWDGAGSH